MTAEGRGRRAEGGGLAELGRIIPRMEHRNEAASVCPSALQPSSPPQPPPPHLRGVASCGAGGGSRIAFGLPTYVECGARCLPLR